MSYKILYFEDLEPETYKEELERHDFLVEHHDPEDFETSLEKVKGNIDLLLLDFRLSSKTAAFDAPTIAQTVRTIHSDSHCDIPIVLISTEDNISGYYKDFTSQDLFDFAVSKKEFTDNIAKYSTKLKSLIEGYKTISERNGNGHGSLFPLLNRSTNLKDKFNSRVMDILESDKYTSNTYMASDFLLNHIVRPAGLLIGKEVLLTRLGLEINVQNWECIEPHLADYKYSGIYSDAYERWWFSGIESWWTTVSPENKSLKRLSAVERVEILKEKLGTEELQAAVKNQYAKSDYFWTICQKHKSPLDPIDGFEVNRYFEPWEDKAYYSPLAASELMSLKDLKPIDRKRFVEFAEKE